MDEELLRERRAATAQAVLSAIVFFASTALFYLCLDVPGIELVPEEEVFRAIGIVRLSICFLSVIPLTMGIECWTESMIRRARLWEKIRRKLAEDVMLS